MTAIYSRKNIGSSLSARERALLKIIALIFSITLLSSVANGWDYQQTKGLGVYIRWLLVIPIYLLIRNCEKSFFWLANGSALASFVLFFQSIYDINFLMKDRVYGVYDSPGLVGIQALVFVITLAGAIAIYCKDHRLVFLYSLGLFAACACILLSGSRSTYFTLSILVPTVIFMFFKSKNAALILGCAAVCFSALFFSSDFLNSRVKSGFIEAKNYFELSNAETSIHNSVGSRFEMWKVALMVSKEHPILGVGWRNFQKNTTSFAEGGRVSVSATEHPHPHSMYLEALVTTGASGLFLVLTLFIYSVRIGMKASVFNHISGNLLIIFCLAFMFNGINEGGSLIYGNALSFFLIYLVVFVSFSQSKSRLRSPFRVNH